MRGEERETYAHGCQRWLLFKRLWIRCAPPRASSSCVARGPPLRAAIGRPEAARAARALQTAARTVGDERDAGACVVGDLGTAEVAARAEAALPLTLAVAFQLVLTARLASAYGLAVVVGLDLLAAFLALILSLILSFIQPFILVDALAPSGALAVALPLVAAFSSGDTAACSRRPCCCSPPIILGPSSTSRRQRCRWRHRLPCLRRLEREREALRDVRRLRCASNGRCFMFYRVGHGSRRRKRRSCASVGGCRRRHRARRPDRCAGMRYPFRLGLLDGSRSDARARAVTAQCRGAYSPLVRGTGVAHVFGLCALLVIGGTLIWLEQLRGEAAALDAALDNPRSRRHRLHLARASVVRDERAAEVATQRRALVLARVVAVAVAPVRRLFTPPLPALETAPLAPSIAGGLLSIPNTSTLRRRRVRVSVSAPCASVARCAAPRRVRERARLAIGALPSLSRCRTLSLRTRLLGGSVRRAAQRTRRPRSRPILIGAHTLESLAQAMQALSVNAPHAAAAAAATAAVAMTAAAACAVSVSVCVASYALGLGNAPRSALPACTPQASCSVAACRAESSAVTNARAARRAQAIPASRSTAFCARSDDVRAADASCRCADALGAEAVQRVDASPEPALAAAVAAAVEAAVEPAEEVEVEAEAMEEQASRCAHRGADELSRERCDADAASGSAEVVAAATAWRARAACAALCDAAGLGGGARREPVAEAAVLASALSRRATVARPPTRLE
eukprot:1605036-Pleurochrysis_carterae.AAC.3